MQKKIVYIILGLFTVTCASILTGLVIYYNTNNTAKIPANTNTTSSNTTFTQYNATTPISSNTTFTRYNAITPIEYLGPLRGDLPDKK